VCDTTADMVKNVLTDFFSCLVEINRKTKKEVRINFGRQLGSLCLNLSGHISFEAPVKAEDDSLSFFRAVKTTRDNGSDAGSVLDNASAILSRGGGYAFSVKSGFLSNITVETPKSFFSKRSNTLSKAGHATCQFNKYRGKTNVLKNANDIFEAASQRSAASSYRAAAPNPSQL